MELGPEDVFLLERCPNFRGCYVQASMELGPEDVSLLERCPGVMYRLQRICFLTLNSCPLEVIAQTLVATNLCLFCQLLV